MGRWAWCADGIDFDNDGTPEIFITTGMLTNTSERRPQRLGGYFWRQVVAKSPVTESPAPDYENGWNAINQLIRQDYNWCGHEPNVFYKRVKSPTGDSGKFYDFSGVSGLDFADDSRAFAATDIDNDGNLDIVLKSRLAPQIRILRNHWGAARRSIVVRLRGTKSNRDGIGASVRLKTDSRTITRWVQAGSGFLSQHTKTLHFGLDQAPGGRARITWPSGLVQEFDDLEAGFVHTLTEGSDGVVRTPFRLRQAGFGPGSPGIEPVVGENTLARAPAWLLEAVPLPDDCKGPGFGVHHRRSRHGAAGRRSGRCHRSRPRVAGRGGDVCTLSAVSVRLAHRIPRAPGAAGR